MPRKRYLFTYDVADDKRRTQIFNTLLDYGDHAQYSVFFCDLNRSEHVRLRSQLECLVDHAADQILMLELGSARDDYATVLSSIGKHFQPPVRCTIV